MRKWYPILQSKKDSKFAPQETKKRLLADPEEGDAGSLIFYAYGSVYGQICGQGFSGIAKTAKVVGNPRFLVQIKAK